jgi:ATP-dependent helicase/nuclease subunit A
VSEAALHPQVLAADPSRSAFVSANAGSGKTKTLVDRVARLLLNGARPEAILCVTYTKAAAAEMQRRLFGQLGGWAVMDDATLRDALAQIGEAAGDLSRARTLFAHALEAPGGLKIETLHAFCEKLLRRFPLEAGVSPGFQVMDDAGAAVVSGAARDALARLAMAGQAQVAAAYAAMAARLDFGAFEEMFRAFEARREAIAAYLDRIGGLAALADDVAARCGLPPGPLDMAAIRAEAVSPPALDPALWREAAAVLATGSASDQKNAARMSATTEAALGGRADFAEAADILLKADGEGRKWVETAAVLKGAPALQTALLAERERLAAVVGTLRAVQVAEATVHVLTLAAVYVDRFEAAKARRGWLDFTDLTLKARALLEDGEEAAWVLYKLDGGVEHVLLDEAQDTAPEQWDILSALTGEFFAGAGSPGAGSPSRTEARLERTVFLVGDEKQSIYSFQGARPERLAQEADRYAALAAGAGRPFARVPLLVSYRSAPQVLDYVDAAFASDAARAALQPRAPGVAAASELVRHIAHRAADQGTIELWDLEREVDDAHRRAWDAPLDDKPTSAYRRLAERIAAEIKALVARGDAVHDKDGPRPAAFGDVLVLVRKRKALFEELLRACKHAGVPVAGADRLKLSAHPVFADLMALTRTALYPHDDLSLAEVLRSPFCDVDEDGLYALARGADGCGRSGALWSELTRRAPERADWRGALELIGWMRDQAGAPPFVAYSRLLARLDPEGRSMRQRIVTRLGAEAGDAVDEMLAQALAAEGRGVFDLERFADQASRLDITVKREMDAPRGEVQIMTAHSAKGLERHIVFLPETVGGGGGRGSPLMETEDGGFLWCGSATADCAASAAVRARRDAAEAAEALRLLYVALTRARDRVVIAGRVNATAKIDAIKGWWTTTAAAFDHPALAGQVRDLVLDGRPVRRFGPDPAAIARPAAAPEPPVALPAWTGRFAPAEDGPSGTAAPSSAAAGRAPAPSPLAVTLGLGRFRRGELIHRLLQLLPDLAPDAWDEAARRLLAKERDLDDAQRTEMAAAALGVLRDARFAEVFGPGSRAEASVAGTAPGLPDGYRLSGRVDRMVVSPERVLVVDFKTNRPAPDRIEDADIDYITQIALYAAVLRAIFPGRAVEGALVWTDGPKLMAVPEEMMAEALARL